jgi:rare lipoprotein A
MKQISGFVIVVFLIVAAFSTLQAQDNMTGDGIYDPSIVPAETAPLNGTGSAAFREDGIASWYGTEFEGHPTASGELFNPSQMTAAHPTLPFGTMLRVTNTQNSKQVVVRVNDRGPFVNTRIIDVSRAAAEMLDMIRTGTAPVLVELAGEGASLTLPAATAEPSNSDPWIAPIPPAPQPAYPAYPTYPVQPPAAAQQPAQPVYPAYPVQPPAAVQQPAQPVYPAPQPPAPAPATVQPPVFSVQPPATYSSTPAVVKPKMPPLGTNKRYRIQVGAYQNTRNAVDAFDRVKSAGFEPAYERYNDYYRVVITGIPADKLQTMAEKLGAAGFREVLVREE